MQFTSKLTGLLITIAASAMSVQALAAAPRDAGVQQADSTVTLFDDIDFSGEAYVPQGVEIGVSFNLPEDWANRAQSLIVSDEYICRFFDSPDSQGTGVFLQGTNPTLPGELDQQIESFTCFIF